MRVLNQAFDEPLKLEEKASAPFAGGIMQYGYQCGMIWGAALAAGAQVYRLHGAGPPSEAMAIAAAQRIVEDFRGRANAIDCYEITEINRSSSTLQMIMYFLIRGGSIRCFRMAAGYAPEALKGINETLSQKQIEPPSPPVSCTAMLAEKMGASQMQIVMASGLAGGIGMCGGACGALGAAIWITAMNRDKNATGKINFKDPGALALIDNFLNASGHQFKCSEIVGRKFANITDHANFLHDGGCSEIIEALAEAALPK